MAAEPTTSESLSGVGLHDAAQASAQQNATYDDRMFIESMVSADEFRMP